MLPSLIWFITGASLSLMLRRLIYTNEQRKIFVSIIASYVPIILRTRKQLESALKTKEEWLEEVGLSKEESANQCAPERELIKNWDLITTSILVGSIPRKYHKYLELRKGSSKS